MKTDGILNEHEWKTASVFVLKDQKNFNNKIKSSVVKVCENQRDGFVYLGIMTEFKSGGEIENGKIKIAVNNSKASVISISDGLIESGDYPVEAASRIDESTGYVFTEISVFFKDCAKRSDIIKLNIYDLYGTESGTYTITLKEDETTTVKTTTQKETTTKTTKTTTTKTTTTKTTKTTTTKTTTTKTTKPTTTKTTTTKTTKSTTATTEKRSKTSKPETEKEEKSVTTEKSSKKSKSTTKDDFTFSKVVKTTTKAVPVAAETSTQTVETTSSENSSKETSASTADNQSEYEEEETANKKYLYLIIGAVCAAGVAVAAVAITAKSDKNGI